MGSFAFRETCYDRYGWTPRQVRTLLRKDPQEAQLLAIFFEELALAQAKALNQPTPSHSAGPSDNLGHGEFVVEEVIGEDDIDWKDAD